MGVRCLGKNSTEKGDPRSSRVAPSIKIYLKKKIVSVGTIR